MSDGKSMVRWLFAAAAVVLGLWAGNSLKQQLRPFGVAMSPADGSQAVDPRGPITVEAVGWGVRLTKVSLTDSEGRLLAEGARRTRVTLPAPLAFGTTYRITAIIERPWTARKETRELTLSTVEIPRLEGAAERPLAADGSVTLHFDRPVGQLHPLGEIRWDVETDASTRVFRLMPHDHPQGTSVPLDLAWTTGTGVPLPPLHLSITTPPALSAEISPRDLTNIGLAMPIRIKFSEAVAERENVTRHIMIRTDRGSEVAGRWSWLSKTLLQFNPVPGWPASSTIEVTEERRGLRSAQGGYVEQPLATRFATGTDRRIFVYLDAQRMSAVENGQVVKTFKVSTGKAATPTVAGSFYIYARFPIKTMRSRAKPGEHGHYVVENVPYAQYFYADYAFHGAWWHNAFGRPASHGCVNMSTRTHNRRWPGAPEDAGWLYQWASLGVPVTVLRTTSPQRVAMQ